MEIKLFASLWASPLHPGFSDAASVQTLQSDPAACETLLWVIGKTHTHVLICLSLSVK